MNRMRPARLVATLLAVGLVAPQGASAARQLPIGVDVQVDPALVAGVWPEAQTRAVAESVRRELTVRLQDRFTYWLFREERPAARRLELVLHPGRGDSAAMTLRARLDGRVRELAEPSIWLPEGERSTRGFPRADAAPARILRHLELALAGGSLREVVDRWLRETIPVAPEGRWIPTGPADRPMVALSLPMDEFKGLRKSVFRIASQAPAGHTEEVEVVGIELPVPYPPDAPAALFTGIAALAERHIVGTRRFEIDATRVERVRALQLGPVYLVEPRPVTPFGADDWVDR